MIYIVKKKQFLKFIAIGRDVYRIENGQQNIHLTCDTELNAKEAAKELRVSEKEKGAKK